MSLAFPSIGIVVQKSTQDGGKPACDFPMSDPSEEVGQATQGGIDLGRRGKAVFVTVHLKQQQGRVNAQQSEFGKVQTFRGRDGLVIVTIVARAVTGATAPRAETSVTEPGDAGPEHGAGHVDGRFRTQGEVLEFLGDD